MPEFKFEIGEIVLTKIGIAEAQRRCRIGESSIPNSLMILERHTQECPGGLQIHYTLSGTSGNIRLNEIELAKSADWNEVEMDEIASKVKAEHRRKEIESWNIGKKS